LFNGDAFERIEKSPIKEIVVLDTVPLREPVNTTKIKMLSIDKVFAAAIDRIHTNKPVSPLFN
jgi:ribose-phosphate pyrophosphokinase